MLCAYRKKYGTEHVLIKLIDLQKVALDENKYAGTVIMDLSKAFDCVIMDLSKAFDCVPYRLLICKMHAYGLIITLI